ncbi:DUF2141 domain-containing protein [Novosphingobium sp.]|uniref:DUF2141 domain-containing protein n=1 Tax=Novosphingobium sp. TaxID=1874826 RepID=UPI00273386A8|nr:DUF2141 domain-containing protein [Novosphingobium sp.]MDP3907592.1 DUF2141 domain-containing protein [Novosphingobium sp.]
MKMPNGWRAVAAAIAPVALASAALMATSATASEGAPTPPPGCTGTPSQTWLNVVADGMKNGDGLLAVTLYADNPSKFLVKRGSLYVGRVNATAGTTRACIFVPKPGVYALALYHDENANQSFDRTGVGFPAEGFGFTNNPATLAGLPAFKSVRLNVPKAGLTTRIQMKYP